MTVETASDRIAMLADFGVNASYKPLNGSARSIKVIFDDEYVPVDTGGGIAFAMNQPKALAKSSDLTGTIENGSLIIAGISYLIKIVMSDGTGITELMLERQ